MKSLRNVLKKVSCHFLHNSLETVVARQLESFEFKTFNKTICRNSSLSWQHQKIRGAYSFRKYAVAS